jgi:peptidyl-prolyl cis-trans isomerase A (cyclophilin A)
MNDRSDAARAFPRTAKAAILSLFGSLMFWSACQRPPEPAQPAPSQALLDPSKDVEKAPDVFKVAFKTTKGDFVLEVHRSLAPVGVDRFYNLVKIGYYDDTAFFRVVPGFVVQWGVNGLPQINAVWKTATIEDDPANGRSNVEGMITFATAGANTRTTQLFINLHDNANLDAMGFVPFGWVISGMNVVGSLYSGYGDGAPYGSGPDQERLQNEGNAYLKESFPSLDYIENARIQ